jgi:hypothetical protein
MSMAFWTANTPYILIGLTVLVCGLGAWAGFLHVKLTRTRKQYARLMTGVETGSLEQVLNQHIDQLQGAMEQVNALEERTSRAERTLKHALQWMGLIRFSPFRDTGGAQSFALAILDQEGHGVVVSSLHSRQNTRIYAKALANWESQHPLTDEEKEAIARARPGHI